MVFAIGLVFFMMLSIRLLKEISFEDSSKKNLDFGIARFVRDWSG